MSGYNESGIRKPKFNFIGQDVKVMVIRENEKVDITMCIPVLSIHISNLNEYYEKLDFIQNFLDKISNEIAGNKYKINLKVNHGRDTKYRKYILGIGSCVECGEEGLVGRGNNNNGVISIFRPHTMEAPSGKNPKYHTGRVLGFLINEISENVYNHYKIKNSIICITDNQSSLIPPKKVLFSSNLKLDENIINQEVEKTFNSDYINKILNYKIP